MMPAFSLVIAMLLIAGVSTAHACKKTPGDTRQHGVGIYIDQDMFLPGVNKDRDYTMGFAAEWYDNNHQQMGYVLLKSKRILDRIFGVWRGKDTGCSNSYMVGSVNYTPDDLSVSGLIKTDRPYSSLIYLSNKQVAIRDHERIAIGTELQVGLLGTSIAEQAQSSLHRLTRNLNDSDEPVDPKGWDNQISDGGEPTFRYRVAVSALLGPESKDRSWDVSTTLDASMGYQTNASVSLAFRAGDIHSNFWTLPFDPISRGTFIPASSGDELYGWGVIRGRLVAYDAHLQGQFRDSRLTYDGSEIERFVLELGAGVTASYGPVQLTLSVNGKTPELDIPGRSPHIWGGLYVMVRY